MLIEDYYALVAVDLPAIRRDRVDADAARIPALHDKYLKFMIEEQKVLRTMERSMDRLRLQKSQYYLGKADPEVYKTKLYQGKIFNLQVLKTDLPLYLAADEELGLAVEHLVGDGVNQVRLAEAGTARDEQRVVAGTATTS